MKKFFVVIPARLKSKRLPNKPLIKIQGKELIFRTYQQCVKAVNRKNIIVATDSLKILNFCKKKDQCDYNFKKCLTGTDRVAEVAKNKKQFLHYLQGDEPFFNQRI